jgi:hypothetical protein
VALVAATVSYLHLHDLMRLAGETPLARNVGPLAIDGMLFGCTVALLITNAARNEGTEDPERDRTPVDRLRATLDTPLVPAVPEVPAVEQVPEVPAIEPAPVPVPDTELVPVPSRVPVQRGPGRVTWDVAKAVQMILDGQRDATVADAVGIGAKVIQRTRRAVTLLREDPHAEVPREWKVPADVVQVIRTEIPR